MKYLTKWKRIYNPVVGKSFFDGGKYTLGFFTIEKLWICKEYSSCAVTSKGSHWFDKKKMRVRTDTGRVYEMPFFPWMEVTTADGKNTLSEIYYSEPFTYKRKPEWLR